MHSGVDELAAELAETFPDPVDLFEDDLACKLGLRDTRVFAAGPVTTAPGAVFINALDEDRS